MDDGFIPEKALVFEVIKRAIKDSLGQLETEYKINGCNISHYEIRKARAWLNTRYDGNAPPFSMEWCCDILGADPRRVRRYALSLTRADTLDAVARNPLVAVGALYEGSYNPTVGFNLKAATRRRAA